MCSKRCCIVMYWKNWNDLPNTVCNVIVNWGIRAVVKASAHQNVIRVHHRTPGRHMSWHKGLLSTCRRFKQVIYSITDKTGRVGQCCVRMGGVQTTVRSQQSSQLCFFCHRAKTRPCRCRSTGRLCFLAAPHLNSANLNPNASALKGK